MKLVLVLLTVQASLGAFDTLYFHEWRARLVARIPTTTEELRLHAARDFVYAILFATLPVLAWRGAWTFVLIALLIVEIVVTMGDFIVEERVRRPLGGVFPGERVTHALMGIVYGAMLGYFVPILHDWSSSPTGIVIAYAGLPLPFTIVLLVIAAGVAVSGMRDLYALLELPRGSWPWKRQSVA